MNASIFIETRDFKGLNQKFKDHLRYLPGWDAIAICSKDNEYQFTEFERIIIDHPHNRAAYNYMITRIEFWERLSDYERILSCEHESGILRYGVDEFLEWDYIGAPWPFQEHGANGGFSIRNPKAMIKTIEYKKYNSMYGNEDTYFCNNFKGNLAPRSECLKFSVETEYRFGTFGYHFGSDARRFLTENQMNDIRNQYESVN